jgi:hypothetical protein
LLGDSILKGYYSTHDYDRKMFGFAPHAQSTKDAPVKGKIPEEPLGSTTSTTLIIVLVIGTLVLIGVAIGLIATFTSSKTPEPLYVFAFII